MAIIDYPACLVLKQPPAVARPSCENRLFHYTHLQVKQPDLTLGFDALGFFVTSGVGGVELILTCIRQHTKGKCETLQPTKERYRSECQKIYVVVSCSLALDIYGGTSRTFSFEKNNFW